VAARNSRGFVRRLLGEYEQAIDDYSRSLTLVPDDRIALENLAWIKATCPHAELRDAETAVKYALKACILSRWEHPEDLQTLAAAFAEAGDFTEATRWQFEAWELASEEQKDKCHQRLGLYASGNPYREISGQD
jgi:tetratricopeptide (TPR) repeat protein